MTNPLGPFIAWGVFHPASEPTTVPGVGSYVDRPVVIGKWTMLALFPDETTALAFRDEYKLGAQAFVRPVCLTPMYRVL